MRQHNYKLLPLLALLVLAASTPAHSRRVRVSRPQSAAAVAAAESTAAAEDQESRSQQVQYYAAQAEEAEPERQIVLVPSDEAAYYGRPALQRQSEAYRPRAQLVGGPKPTLRIKEAPKQPPVQTISNYNKVNDDGSFTFGYEAADGSFKEETRGTDCVVRGKYGYVDPDGNKREFSYVSGNPCDPNAKDEEDDDKPILADDGEENVPKGPIRPLRPRPNLAPRPTTTVFQNNYVQDEEAVDAVPQQVLYRTTSSPRLVSHRPTPTSVYEPQQQVVTARPTPRPQPAVRITPRPYSASTTVRAQLPATTYRPRLHAAAPTPAPLPGVIYSNSAQPTSSPHSSTSAVDFDETLRQFQLENNVLTTPRSVAHAPQPRPHFEQLAAGKPTGQALYETQLVYDPASGQYQTVFYQKPPQGSPSSDISQRHRLQPFASSQQHIQPQQQQHQQQQPQLQHHQQRLQFPQPLYTQQAAAPQQVYQQQQAAVVQQSQQLYTQQQQRQRALALQQPQQSQQHLGQQSRFTQFQSPAQQRYPSQQQYYQQAAASQQQLQKQPSRQFYYASQGEREGASSHGPIDAFLRSHNIAY